MANINETENGGKTSHSIRPQLGKKRMNSNPDPINVVIFAYNWLACVWINS